MRKSSTTLTTHSRVGQSTVPLDVVAFDRLYRETAPLVLRALRRLVPPAQVDDAAQDVFLTIARRLPEFQHRSKPSTWVYGIVLRVAADHRRRLLRTARRTQALAAEPPGSERSPESNAERSSRVRLLHRVLGSMRDDMRELLVLADLEQLPGPEIAELLGLNPNTMHARLRAARLEFNTLVQRARADERT